jgi:glycosyltransferase involved in cell wall biosynthesis
VEVVLGFNDTRIHLTQQENQGVSAARNQGIEASEGELIAFLDADDEWLPSFLETILCLNKQYPDAGMLILTHIENNQMNNIKKIKYTSIPDHPWEGILPNYFKSVTLDNKLICSSSVCIPKYIFNEIGVFKIKVLWGEDEDLWGRIAIKYPIVFSTHVGTIVHIVESKINLLRKRINYTKIHPFISEANNLISENLVPNSILEDLKEYIAFLQILTASYHLDLGNRNFVRQILKECNTNRFKKEKLWLRIWSFVPTTIYNNVFIMKFRELIISWVRNNRLQRIYQRNNLT